MDLNNIYKHLEEEQCKTENEICDIINLLNEKLTYFYACGGGGQYHIRIADNMSWLVNKHFNIDELYNDEEIERYVEENNV